MAISDVSFVIPVVPEPLDSDPDSYFWSTTVKDAANQLSSAVSAHNDSINSITEGIRQAYGMISVLGASDTQNIGTTPSKITGFNANGPTLRCSSDHTNDKITISLPGVYAVATQVSFTGSPSAVFTVNIYKTASNTSIGFLRAIGTGGDVGSGSAVGLLDCIEGDEITLYGNADSAAKNATLINAQLTAHLLA